MTILLIWLIVALVVTLCFFYASGEFERRQFEASGSAIARVETWPLSRDDTASSVPAKTNALSDTQDGQCGLSVAPLASFSLLRLNPRLFV